MKIISVIPLKKGIWKGDLTYFSSLNISPGDIVSVPIRGKKTLALVASAEEVKESKSNIKGMNFSLKKVIENKGNSFFLPEFFDTASDIGKYFAQNKNRVFSSLIPNIFLEEYDKIKKISTLDKPTSGEKKEQKLRTEKLLFQYPVLDRVSIYKTLIRESFARGKSIFMILPTEFDIEKFASQLSKGIEQFTFSVHSGINTKKNLTTLQKIITSTHPVLIIGTPPFLSIPKKDIGTIILEHENSNAYKMIKRPYLDLRVFAEVYASKINAKFIMADEMLRFETIGRKDVDNFNPLHPLSFRIDFAGEIEILGKELKKEGKKFQILKNESMEEIKSVLKNKKNVFIFSLRKGLATQTVCQDCGETISCEECEAPLVLYLSHQEKKRMFVCNRCQRDADGDTVCKSCGSWNLVPLGIGTDIVYEEIQKLLSAQVNFPKVKIFKLDKESVKTAKEAQKIIKEFEENEGSILIGTEMAFFYLKNKVSLSVIASLDSLWSIPNFKMSEKIIQIILSIIGNTTEKLIIQTKNEKDSIISAIKSGNLLSFVREELEDRRKLAYPPFKRFVKITYMGDREQTTKARNILEEIFKEYNPEIFTGFITKLKGKFITNALIKIDPQKWSVSELKADSIIDENLFNKLLSLPPNFEVFVDPEDLL
jgi:primosomal protein N' (replication factor Y)